MAGVPERPRADVDGDRRGVHVLPESDRLTTVAPDRLGAVQPGRRRAQPPRARRVGGRGPLRRARAWRRANSGSLPPSTASLEPGRRRPRAGAGRPAGDRGPAGRAGPHLPPAPADLGRRLDPDGAHRQRRLVERHGDRGAGARPGRRSSTGSPRPWPNWPSTSATPRSRRWATRSSTRSTCAGPTAR